MKQPAMLFYPGDWMKDPELRRCSPAARGVWMDIICLSFECCERGYLISNGNPWSDDDIVSAISGDKSGVRKGLTELLAKGVASRDKRGAVCCRRVARDAEISRKRAIAGAKGGKRSGI
ncbi:MAG: hypothetical protein ACE5HE_09195, partial [Phycisphaerae bacterium]